MKTKLEKPICRECKSDNITVDAEARWDVSRQEWVFDKGEHYYCVSCDEISIKWVRVSAAGSEKGS